MVKIGFILDLSSKNPGVLQRILGVKSSKYTYILHFKIHFNIVTRSPPQNLILPHLLKFNYHSPSHPHIFPHIHPQILPHILPFNSFFIEYFSKHTKQLSLIVYYMKDFLSRSISYCIVLYIICQSTHMGMSAQNLCNFATVKRFDIFSKFFLQ